MNASLLESVQQESEKLISAMGNKCSHSKNFHVYDDYLSSASPII